MRNVNANTIAPWAAAALLVLGAGSVPAAAVSYSSAVLTDAPLAYWRLEETGGTVAADASGNGRDGTYDPAAVSLGATGGLDGGNTSKAVYFNGTGGSTNQPVRLPDALLTGPGFAVELVVREPETAGGGTVWWYGENQVSLSAGRVYARYFDNDAAKTARTIELPAGTLAADRWHHIVFTGDGTTLDLYVDGVLAGSVAASGLPMYTYGPTMLLGAAESGTELFTGWVDEVAVYDRGLDAATVAAHYLAARLSVPEPGPIGLALLLCAAAVRRRTPRA